MLKKLIVEDSIEGMAKALEEFEHSMNRGYLITFDLSKLSSERRAEVILSHEKAEQIFQQTARKSNCEGIESEKDSELGSDFISKR